MNSEPRDDALFLELVLVFQQSAWIALGKVQNPHSGKTELDLKGASHAIDMLAMLKTKTQHTLSATERAVIDNALTQLRLNYVAVAAEQVDQKTAGKAGTPKAQSEGPEN